MWRQYEKDIKALPAVERFNTDKQVPPSLPAIANIAYRGGSRVNDLESRIKVSEQSNRLLLEELMKLQQDLKLALRQNEDMVQKERQERLAIREKVEAAESMYNRVAMQLLRTEEKVNMEHTTLATLLNQSKEVERALAGGQQRSMMKGEQIDRYISRFRDELSELRQINEQIQSSLRLVGEDVKSLQHRIEMQNSEFDTVNQEMKQKVKRIENESIAAIENIQRSKTNRENFDGSTSQLRQNIESRLSEIRDAVNEVRRKTDVEASERRAADQQTELNVEKVQVALRELETRYQEVSHAASLNMREKDSVYEVEKSKLAYRMVELTDETNKKALQREMQLKEEAQMKFAILEKRFHEEQTSRLAFEKSVRNEMEKILESLKMHLSGELQNMRQNAKLSKVHEDQSLAKMNECLTLLESEIEAGKKAFEEVLHAEIIARQTQNEKTLEKCNELQEKLAVAVATLQRAISGVTSHTQEAVEQAKNEIFAVLDESTNSGINGLADIDSRLSKLNKHVAELEEAIESRPFPSSSPPTNVHENTPSNNEDYVRLNKKVDRAYKWQEEAEKTLRDLSTRLQPIHSEISKLKAAIEDLENEVEVSRLARLASLGGEESPVAPIAAETNTAHNLELEHKVQKAEDDIEQISTQMEKLEHTVNTLRTVLSQKISSEAKTVEHLRQVFTGDIEKMVNYFIREQRRVFIKHRTTDAKVYRPDLTIDGEQQAHSLRLALLSINRWGVYEAYKMLKLKRTWFKLIENSAKRPESDNYIDYEEQEKEAENNDKLESGKEDEEENSDDEEKSEENEKSEEENESEEDEESEEEDSEEEDEEESEGDESQDEEDDENESGKETEEESEKSAGKEKPNSKAPSKP